MSNNRGNQPKSIGKLLGTFSLGITLTGLILLSGCSKQDSATAVCGQPYKFRSKTIFGKHRGKRGTKWRNTYPLGNWREHEWQAMYKLDQGVDLGTYTSLYQSLDFNGGSGASQEGTTLGGSSSSNTGFGGSSSQNAEGLDAAEQVFENFKQVMANTDALDLEIFSPASKRKPGYSNGLPGSNASGNGRPDGQSGYVPICAAACVNPMLVAIQGSKIIGDKLKAVKENMELLREKIGTEEEEEAKAQFALLNEEKIRYEWKIIQIQAAMRDAYTSCQKKSFATATNVRGSGARQRSALIAENFKASAMETCTCDVGIDWAAMTGDDNPFDSDDNLSEELEGDIVPGWPGDGEVADNDDGGDSGDDDGGSEDQAGLNEDFEECELGTEGCYQVGQNGEGEECLIDFHDGCTAGAVDGGLAPTIIAADGTTQKLGKRPKKKQSFLDRMKSGLASLMGNENSATSSSASNGNKGTQVAAKAGGNDAAYSSSGGGAGFVGGAGASGNTAGGVRGGGDSGFDRKVASAETGAEDPINGIDPANYFKLLNKEDNLLRVVRVRYRKKEAQLR